MVHVGACSPSDVDGLTRRTHLDEIVMQPSTDKAEDPIFMYSDGNTQPILGRLRVLVQLVFGKLSLVWRIGFVLPMCSHR